MESLPKDVAIEMALNLSPVDVIRFCSASKAQNRICNSNDFWRRKLDRDYPGDFLPGTILTNAKELYIKRFTYISRRIEEFMENIIRDAFPENFSRFFNKDYKKELYLKLYKLYEMVKNEEYKEDGESEEDRHIYESDNINDELTAYIPNSSLTGYESIDIRLHRFLYELIEEQKLNKNK